MAIGGDLGFGPLGSGPLGANEAPPPVANSSGTGRAGTRGTAAPDTSNTGIRAAGAGRTGTRASAGAVVLTAVKVSQVAVEVWHRVAPPQRVTQVAVEVWRAVGDATFVTGGTAGRLGTWAQTDPHYGYVQVSQFAAEAWVVNVPAVVASQAGIEVWRRGDNGGDPYLRASQVAVEVWRSVRRKSGMPQIQVIYY